MAIYYISNAGSNGANGTSEGTSWQTLSKLNSVTLVAGDQVLLKRGDTWAETLTVNQSGSVGNPITYGAYSTGAKPVITGFTTVSAWTDLGGGIQESTSAVTSSDYVNLVTFDGAFQAMGRWPKTNAANAGYLLFQSHSGEVSITSNAIASALSYIGGEVVIRAADFVLDRGLISAQTSTTVTYSKIKLPAGFISYVPQDGWGFFFQNHSNACTILGEWAFVPSTKKIRMYFGGAAPASYVIKVTALDVLINIQSNDYITFDNLSITGANISAFQMNLSNNIQINNCDISFSGVTAIDVLNGNSTTIVVDSCTINYTNNNAITANSSSAWTITNNTITNTGAVRGMGLSGGSSHTGIVKVFDDSLIEFNVITHTGYNGMDFRGTDTIVRHNLIDTFNTILQDGGGIYTYAETTATGRIVQNNIVLNGIGDHNGEPSGAGPNTYGIYIDGGARNVEITGNTVANCAFGGVELNYPQNVLIDGNTFFNNGLGGVTSNSSAGLFINRSGGETITNLDITNNILFAKLTEQLIIYTNTSTNNFSTWGTIDNNFYCRPINEPSGINGIVGFNEPPPYNDGGIIVAKIGANTRFYSLDAWQTLSGVDAATVKTPMTINDVADLRFEYNATNAPVVVPLSFNYMDARGVTYNGTITLQPYTSAVLIKNGAITGIFLRGKRLVIQ